MGLPFGQLSLAFEDPADEIADRYLALIGERSKHKPLAYLIGKKEFYSRDFSVGEEVLIPRPETENLVSAVLERLPEGELMIADLCSGSGCIGITLALESGQKVDLYELSEAAAAYSKKNARSLAAEGVAVFRRDILQQPLLKMYDVIVSNPPYIPIEDMKLLMPDVRDYEPVMALTDGGDGLLFYHRLAALANHHLKDGGILAAEVGIHQHQAVAEIFSALGSPEIVTDYFGVERVVLVKKETMPMKLTEKILDSKTYFQGNILNLRVDRVELENGTTATREIVVHPGGVCVIGMEDDGSILMVRQYRAPFGRALLEVPAGKLNPGEDPLTCGKREFLEETGYEAREYVSFGALYPSVGFLTEVLHIYYAKGLTKKEQHLDEDEFLNVERYTLEELMTMVEDNTIKDAKTVVAILKLANYISKQAEENRIC